MTLNGCRVMAPSVLKVLFLTIVYFLGISNQSKSDALEWRLTCPTVLEPVFDEVGKNIVSIFVEF